MPKKQSPDKDLSRVAQKAINKSRSTPYKESIQKRCIKLYFDDHLAISYIAERYKHKPAVRTLRRWIDQERKRRKEKVERSKQPTICTTSRSTGRPRLFTDNELTQMRQEISRRMASGERVTYEALLDSIGRLHGKRAVKPSRLSYYKRLLNISNKANRSAKKRT